VTQVSTRYRSINSPTLIDTFRFQSQTAVYWILEKYFYLGYIFPVAKIRPLTKCQIIGNGAKTGKSENKHLQNFLAKKQRQNDFI